MHHVTQAPSFTRNPHNGDVYSAYNKPEAVIDWLAHNEIEEDFVLILDADMIMRAPFIPEDLGAKEGTAISAYYGYLKVHCQLRHHNLDDTVSACIALKPLAVAVEYDVSINVGVSTLTSGSGPLSCAIVRRAGRQQCAGAEACARGAAAGGRAGGSQGAPRRPGAHLVMSYQIWCLHSALSRVQASLQMAEQDMVQQLIKSHLVCRSGASS
jgi:hypothetical protein